MSRNERGMALLEVMLALTILGIAVAPTLAWLGQGMRNLRVARDRERELLDEERLLAAHALLDSRDLSLRLGAKQIGPYVVVIQQPDRSLFRIALRRHDSGTEDLVTVVYRPVAARVNQ